jgi:hypothetical protein
MQFLKTVSCLMVLHTGLQTLYAQTAVLGNAKRLFNISQFIQTDSGIIIHHINKEACKNTFFTSEFIPAFVPAAAEQVTQIVPEQAKPHFMTIHGNVSYDFFYRSKIDTPFSQQNLQQHTERVWLDILVKEKYPLKVGFTLRQSNSPFLRDLFNANLNFDKYNFNKNLKQQLIARLTNVKWQNPDLKTLDAALAEQKSRYQNLKNFVSGPAILQKIIEERERLFLMKQKIREVSATDTFTSIEITSKIKLNNGQTITWDKDSLVNTKDMAALPKPDSSFLKYFESKKGELENLEKSIVKLEYQSDSIKKSITQSILKAKQSIYKAANIKDLDKIAKQNGLTEPKKEKLQAFLANVKHLGVGRNLVDYTELTAQNIMLTGINLEYNPSYYAAIAAGKIDYGFRDIFGRGIKQKNQYLLLGRLGWGDINKRSVIITLFNGRKNNYPGLLATDSNSNSSRLFGYAIETTVKKNEHSFFSVEMAKSTKNTINTQSQVPANKSDNLFKFSDKTNMGFNIKGHTEIIHTDTKLSGFFRKTGEQFQSFSLFTYNTNQQAWQLKAVQSFLKRKINLTAMLRQNDFTNPLTDKTFKTSTVFKTLQLNIRVPHWPVVNAGYYPGSQFYIVDNKTVRENAYYILNGSVLHAYNVKHFSMNSSFVYNRYFNKATDSGFVFYKGVNYILSQSVLLHKLQVEGSYSYNKQTELNFFTLNANGDYAIKKYLKIGAGIKFNHVQDGLNYWGESIRLAADFKKFGGLQLHYEKSYLPTLQQTLYPVEIGRVSWYKIF